MFITNTCILFHLRWKKNLVKHQKVLKYYENDCLHFAFYVVAGNSNCLKQLYLGWNLLYLCSKCPQTNLKVIQHQMLPSVERSER